MLSLRLIRLMETHSGRLADDLFETITTSPESSDLRQVPPDILRVRTHEIYRDLTAWLSGRIGAEMARYYVDLGAKRAEQTVRLSHLIWGIRAAKRSLWDFLEREGLWESPVELHASLELLALIDRFFDDAVYYATLGHERYQTVSGLGTHMTHPWHGRHT